MSETGYVYTLNDPRTGEPKYVGATKNPQRRLYGHRSSATNEKVTNWINELEQEDLSPEMTLVEVTKLEELSRAEKQVINRLSNEWELLNADKSTPYPGEINSHKDKYPTGSKVDINLPEKPKTTETITDPELVETKNVDGQGRVYLKSDLANKTVRVVIEVIEE